MKNFFEGKKILVTGGTGSIGLEIVKELLKYKPAQIRIFSRNEAKQVEVYRELKNNHNLRFLLGDVRDISRLKMAVKGIDIIFHAAALKHIPLCEYNPFEAFKTNVAGTQNLIEAALEEDVDRFLAISTDKAVNPVSTLGATKLLSERLVLATYYYKWRETKFACVRFGNVLGSSGSVIPLFREQIAKGGPVTITDSGMTRFVMSINQAVKLILKACAEMKEGEIFILKMPVLRVVDLAEVMIEELAPKYGFKPEKIKVETVGMRNGEKIHEELMTAEEASNALETDDMFIILPHIYTPHLEHFKKDVKYSGKPVKGGYCSRDAKPMTKNEIREFLYKEKII
ncbi:MAG: SDR family NAD(P)-dependent oxidoreductase [Candidatus Aenigmatarchaeota archaeon]